MEQMTLPVENSQGPATFSITALHLMTSEHRLQKETAHYRASDTMTRISYNLERRRHVGVDGCTMYVTLLVETSVACEVSNQNIVICCSYFDDLNGFRKTKLSI